MIDPASFVAHLDDLGVRFYTGVPDSLLKHLCSHVMLTLPREAHVIAANEGAAVGLAIGYHLRTGEAALVYLQNSGFGNAVNPLLSLADRDVYGVPMIVLIGWRGQPGVADEPQHVKQGRVMEAMIAAMDLPYAVLPREQPDADACLTEAVRTATERSSPYLVLVEKDTFAPAPQPASGREDDLTHERPSREEALTVLVESLGNATLNVSTTGMLSRELFELRQRTGQDGSRDFLTVGGMGHASSIAMGIAVCETEREVWCLDGDGAALMHLGTLAVVADHGAPLFHVVFNNGVHDSVGGQPTAVGAVDLPAMAQAAGYRRALATDSLDDIPGMVATLRRAGGPSLLELRVRPGNRAGIGRPTRSPAEAKDVFMAALRTDRR
jgi:phosphonopyruvate decarboxylase